MHWLIRQFIAFLDMLQAVSALGGMCEATADMNEMAWRGIGRPIGHISKYEHDYSKDVRPELESC